eukprot:11172685-Ditylum_brightwellii.AAC.1
MSTRGLKKIKPVCVLIDMCTTSLLMDPALLEDPLKACTELEDLSNKSKSQWKTDNRNIESTEQITVENFDFLPWIKKGHSYQIILSMKDIKT